MVVPYSSGLSVLPSSSRSSLAPGSPKKQLSPGGTALPNLGGTPTGGKRPPPGAVALPGFAPPVAPELCSPPHRVLSPKVWDTCRNISDTAQ